MPNVGCTPIAKVIKHSARDMPHTMQAISPSHFCVSAPVSPSHFAFKPVDFFYLHMHIIFAVYPKQSQTYINAHPFSFLPLPLSLPLGAASPIASLFPEAPPLPPLSSPVDQRGGNGDRCRGGRSTRRRRGSMLRRQIHAEATEIDAAAADPRGGDGDRCSGGGSREAAGSSGDDRIGRRRDRGGEADLRERRRIGAADVDLRGLQGRPLSPTSHLLRRGRARRTPLSQLLPFSPKELRKPPRALVKSRTLEVRQSRGHEYSPWEG